MEHYGLLMFPDYSFYGSIFSLKVIFSCQAILNDLGILKATKTFLYC